jgi:hypothetical protein
MPRKFDYNLIPRSSAKTTLGLLRAVKRAILQEPRRANMGVYTCKLQPTTQYFHPAPTCGTVGCFAGWVSILAGQGLVDDDAPAKRLLGDDLDYTFETAGWVRNYYGELVHPTEHVFNSGTGDACANTLPGTRAHAKAVAARIDRFIEKNYALLKGRKLPGLRKRREMAKGWVTE